MCLRLGPRCFLPPSPTAVGVSPKWRTTDSKGTVTQTLGMDSRRRRKRQRRTFSGESSKSKPNPRASSPLMTLVGRHEPLLARALPSSLPQSRQGQERGYFNGRATAGSGKWCVALPHVSMFTVAGIHSSWCPVGCPRVTAPLPRRRRVDTLQPRDGAPHDRDV